VYGEGLGEFVSVQSEPRLSEAATPTAACAEFRKDVHPYNTIPNWSMPKSIMANMGKTSANSTRTVPSSLSARRHATTRRFVGVAMFSPVFLRLRILSLTRLDGF
jgi:hypothetical protein